MKHFILLLIGCVGLQLTARSQNADYSFKDNFDASPPYQLEVATSDGNIDVVAGAGNKVEVLYIAKKNNTTLRISREELEKDFILEVTHTANKLTISIRDRHELRSFHLNRTFVNFKITVPVETACTLRTSDGNLAISGTHGMVTAKTSDGNIRLENIVGNVTSSTSDGNISLTEVNGNTAVNTSDGDISFKDISGSINAITSDGNIRGNLVALTKELSAKTGDGNIDVTMPDHLGLDLDIQGESLKVPLTNFSGKSDESMIRGKSNGGGIAVTLRTSDGHISLKYL